MKMVKSAKTKNNENYSDIKLKEKDYNNEQNLAFFLEQEKKAKKMLEEVKNFRQSFILSKFVDFNHILGILDYINWIDVRIPESKYDYSKVDIYIPFVGIDVNLTYFASVTAKQKAIHDEHANRKYNPLTTDFMSLRMALDWDEFNLIERKANEKLEKLNNKRDVLINSINKKFELLIGEYNYNCGDKIEYLKSVNKTLNDLFGNLIRKYILDNKKIFQMIFCNPDKPYSYSKFLLTGNNVAIKVPSMKNFTIEVSHDEKYVTVESNGSKTWRVRFKAPTFMYYEHDLHDFLSVKFDTKTNEYISHKYSYSYEIDSKSDN